MPIRVLIIDDEIAIAVALRIRLVAMGYEVHSAASGRSGLEAASQCRPNVILLDIRLPDMEGYDVCRQLKRDPDLAPIPVIFISANVRGPAMQAAFDVGGVDYISKPYEAKDVLAAVTKALPTESTVASGNP